MDTPVILDVRILSILPSQSSFFGGLTTVLLAMFSASR